MAKAKAANTSEKATPRSRRASRIATTVAPYVLEEQVGFMLRQVNQRHAALFAERMVDMTPTQWAVLSKLAEMGSVSQNLLGRMTAMDIATIKGVVDRLMKRGLIASRADETDARRRLLALTDKGVRLVGANFAMAHVISQETLAPLAEHECDVFLTLLQKLR